VLVAIASPFAAAQAQAVGANGFITLFLEYTDHSFERAYVAPDQVVVGSGTTSDVSIHGTNGPSSSANLEFQPPEGAELTVGTYQVDGFGPTATEGAIHVTVDSSLCSGVGSFEILEVPTIDGSANVTRFAATFDVSCGGQHQAGVVGIDPTVPVKAFVTDPVDQLDFGSGIVGVAGDPQTIHVKNVGTETVTVNTVALGGIAPDAYIVANACTTILVGSSCDISVRFRPDDSGLRNGWASIATDSVSIAPRVLLLGTSSFGPITNTTPEQAVVIDELPFIHGGNVPAEYANACGASGRSVWYRYTSAEKRRIRFLSEYSSSPPELWQGSAYPTTMLQCSGAQDLDFTALAGVTYWIHLVTIYPVERALVKVTEGPVDDGVAVGGVTRTPETFYPYPDGYLDTVAVKGNRAEPVAVSVRIYNPAGSPVRALSAASASGPFTLRWNGKSTSGVLQPSGKYKLLVFLTDTWGNRLTVTMSVNLSRKRLYTYSYTKTIDAGAYSYHSSSGTGRVSRSGSSYTGGVKLSSGTNGAATTAYNFTLPAATIYKSVRFEVLGVSRIPGPDVGLQDWRDCSAFTTSCVDPWGIGPILYEWHGVIGGAKNVNGSRVARGYLHVSTYAGSNRYVDARDVRVRVSYGILK
jgi:hypothetical protein